MPHNLQTEGYLIDGVYTISQPTKGKCKGYIRTDAGIIEVYKTSVHWLLVPVFLILIATFASMYASTSRTEYYRVSFDAAPLYTGGNIYCTVVNVANMNIEIKFSDEENTSITTLLRPGETLPYIELTFIPTVIVFNDKYTFSLEVRYD